jgi:hypothetical protein
VCLIELEAVLSIGAILLAKLLRFEFGAKEQARFRR